MSELVSQIRRKKRTETPGPYFFEILFCTFGSCTISIDLGIISRERKKERKKKGKAKKFLITDPFFPFLFPDIRNFFPFLVVRRHRSSIDLYEIFHCYRFQRYLPPCTSCFRLPSSVHPVPSNFAISPSLS